MTDLSKIKGYLFDLDGVLYVDNAPIDGAIETVALLKKRKIACRFLTNTSTKSTTTLYQKLKQMGFAIEQDEIISTPYATVLYLRQKPQARCYLLLAEDAKRDFREFPQTEDKPNFIVIGDIGDVWRYSLLNQVFQYMMAGAELIALHKNKFWQTANGLQLDIGAFITGLEYATGKSAIIVGKPSPTFFELAFKDLHLPREQIAVIGDDVEADVGGGQACGLMGILVQTGKFRTEQVVKSTVKPDLIINSIKSLGTMLESL
ncbi:TIGR01458 family HAD-type hydrolase [Beggiatoa leptomitoformis]|uniref:Haloacid dehalogenase-like hydrolase domain-containing protein 2 n=1 Tax=Beggiatoa leptomitoformis TaxID=288004 RepID=A0A2N9YAM0_9GAMM|nr:TIGR01458 family HAD-type hydrolase [Beggiatoa leptomitoformis]ALG67102.1 TIGR01458 family HAD-type hydrolase [Beggiatoa leptomitoformis]AUI67505.1 TIGR01458 family HAD-type hydrolase [Beggiatoa leptomitoformis]